MKKCFCLIVALLCFSLSVTAAPLTRIKGKIVDAGTNKPLDFADVLLFKKGDDNPVFHALPDMDGSFGIADVKNGEYSLMIRLVGYDLFTRQNIVLASSSEIVDLGTIPMKPLEVGLAEVEVVAQKPLVKVDVDKIEYNIEDDRGLFEYAGKRRNGCRHSGEYAVYPRGCRG